MTAVDPVKNQWGPHALHFRSWDISCSLYHPSEMVTSITLSFRTEISTFFRKASWLLNAFEERKAVFGINRRLLDAIANAIRDLCSPCRSWLSWAVRPSYPEHPFHPSIDPSRTEGHPSHDVFSWVPPFCGFWPMRPCATETYLNNKDAQNNFGLQL